jgi:glucans biosynthesis protein C
MNSKFQSEHRFDLDWLRVLAILSVFVFHSARFFDQMGWSIKNPVTYPGVQMLIDFMILWMMPLIFVISGGSLVYAIGKGGFIQFVKDKCLRLLLPFGVGVVTHISLQVYLDRIFHNQFYGSYFDFLPLYFRQLPYDPPSMFGEHLWYLLVLFVFSLALYPLFRLLKGSASNLMHKLGSGLAFPGAVYLLALPLILILALVDPAGGKNMGGWLIWAYIWFFVSGFLIFSQEKLQAAIKRWRWASLALALLSFGSLLGLYATLGQPYFTTPEYALFQLAYGLCAWTLTLTILGFGMQHLTASAPFLKYATPAVLPFYILHQTVLFGVANFVVRAALPDLLKFGVIGVVSFAICVGLYEFVIRRISVLRFLFGMKIKTAQTAPSSRPVSALN